MPVPFWPRRCRQFCRYCVVGGSGVVVDMAVLYMLVAWAGWPAVAGKLVAAQTALLSNFFWNDVWTFRGEGATSRARRCLRTATTNFHSIPLWPCANT